MREIFTYGSVGRAPGNRRFYPENPACRRSRTLSGRAGLQHLYNLQGLPDLYEIGAARVYIYFCASH